MKRSIADNVPKTFRSYMRIKTKARTYVSDLKESDGNLVSEDTEKAIVLNSFFASVFTAETLNHIQIFDTRYNGSPITQVLI